MEYEAQVVAHVTEQLKQAAGAEPPAVVCMGVVSLLNGDHIGTLVAECHVVAYHDDRFHTWTVAAVTKAGAFLFLTGTSKSPTWYEEKPDPTDGLLDWDARLHRVEDVRALKLEGVMRNPSDPNRHSWIPVWRVKFSSGSVSLPTYPGTPQGQAAHDALVSTLAAALANRMGAHS